MSPVRTFPLLPIPRLTTIILLLLLLAISSNFGRAQNFMTRIYESRPGGMTINRGDFNNDGLLDVVVGDATASVFLAKADGTFAAPIRTDGPPTQDIAVGDFNHDGKLDVITANFIFPAEAGGVQVRLGNGDGTFRNGQQLQFTSIPSSITVGDFNNDGNLDFALGADQIFVFAGAGDGTFTPAATLPLTSPDNRISSVRVGDFDGDGRVDLAATTQLDVYVFWNDGGFTFSPQRVSSFSQVWAMTPIDVNQDGYTDLIATFDGCPGVVPTPPGRGVGCPTWIVYLSQGDGTRRFRLEASQTASGFAFGFLRAPTAADINGDGINDLVLLTSGSVLVWLGNANETYQTTPLRFIAADESSADLVRGDFNRDGRIDFAVTNVGNATVAVLLNALPRAPCQTYTLQPSVTVCKPQDDTYSTSPVFITAQTSDNVPVTAMQVYLDNTLFLHSATASLDQFANLASGSHFIVTKAWDVSGRSFHSDRHLTVFTGKPGETCATTAQSLAICSPAQNATVPTAVRVFAAATSDQPITSVQVYIDNALVYDDTTHSNYVDRAFNVSPGSHVIVTKAWDADGRVFTDSRVVSAQ